VIPVAGHDKACACSCQKNVTDHERHERLNYIPPVYKVIVELREKVACPKGCAGEVATAPKPIQLKGKFIDSVLAHIIGSKFDNRQPFYHLAKQFEKRAGFTLSRQTMARSFIECSTDLQPLVNLLKGEIIGNDTVNESNCNAHASRKFESIVKATQGEGLAKQAMRFYKQLYRSERRAKDNNLSP
jgi:transposase